jgi:glutamyl-tRNA reductase
MCAMAVWALGLNHTTAPLDLRGRFTFTVEQMGSTIATLRHTFSPDSEVAILSTCNRTEIYCAGSEAQMQQTMAWLAKSGGVSAEDMKDAVRAASEAGALGTTLNQLFQRSFAVAKEVRSSTEIGAHSISMAAAAVRLASQLFEDLSETRVLFVGAGEMIELCATHFAAKNPKAIAIANRTLERGEKLATQFSGEVMRLADLPQRLHEFDVVISCTASTLPLIGLGAVERALKQRKHRPMFMVDLAVPRDIEPEVKSLEDVYLYTVDDLSDVVQTGQANRQAAVAQAEAIIDAGVQSFEHWMDQRSNVPLIQQLNAQAEDWRSAEVTRARKAIAKGDDVDAVLESLSRGLTQKMLHGAMAELHAGDAESRERARHAIEHFFLRGNR